MAATLASEHSEMLHKFDDLSQTTVSIDEGVGSLDRTRKCEAGKWREAVSLQGVRMHYCLSAERLMIASSFAPHAKKANPSLGLCPSKPHSSGCGSFCVADITRTVRLFRVEQYRIVASAVGMKKVPPRQITSKSKIEERASTGERDLQA